MERERKREMGGHTRSVDHVAAGRGLPLGRDDLLRELGLADRLELAVVRLGVA